MALGSEVMSGIPNWGELTTSLRRGGPISFSAPVLTVPSSMPPSPISHSDTSRRYSGADSWSSDRARRDRRRKDEDLGPFRMAVRKLVESKYFQQGILGAILINTLSMGVEYHNQVS